MARSLTCFHPSLLREVGSLRLGTARAALAAGHETWCGGMQRCFRNLSRSTVGRLREGICSNRDHLAFTVELPAIDRAFALFFDEPIVTIFAFGSSP